MSDSQQRKEQLFVRARSYVIHYHLYKQNLQNLQENLQIGPSVVKTEVSSTKTTFGLHKSLDAFDHEMEKQIGSLLETARGWSPATHIQPGSAHLAFALFIVLARGTLCARVRSSHLLPHVMRTLLRRGAATLSDTLTCRRKFHRYLDGATPTRFGPRPRKSDRGPSFSKIDLQHKGR